MDKRGQKITYRLIISQLKHDNFLNIANQLEEILGIQSRAKNHLSELLESINYHWKIASYYADTACIPQVISKSVKDDVCVLPGRQATTNMRYDEKNYASKATPDALFPSEQTQMMNKKQASGITSSSHENNQNVDAHCSNPKLSVTGMSDEGGCHSSEHGYYKQDVEVEDSKSYTQSSHKSQKFLVLEDSKNDLKKPNQGLHFNEMLPNIMKPDKIPKHRLFYDLRKASSKKVDYFTLGDPSFTEDQLSSKHLEMAAQPDKVYRPSESSSEKCVEVPALHKRTDSMPKLNVDGLHDRVNTDSILRVPNSSYDDKVSKTYENVKRLELSDISRTQLIEMIHEKSEILVIEFFERFHQTCEMLFGSHNLCDLLRATFGESFHTYIDTLNNEEGVSCLYLKEPWKSAPLDQLLEDLHIRTSTCQLEFTPSEKLLLFNITKEGAQSVDVFKSKADKVIFRNSFYTFEQIMSAMFGEHVHHYVIISDTVLRLKKKYRTMSNGDFLLNLGMVKECYSDGSSSDRTCHIKGSLGNLSHPCENTACSSTFVADEADNGDVMFESSDAAREEKKVNFSDVEKVQIIKFLFEKGTVVSTKLFKKVYQITKTSLDGCTLTDLFKGLFGDFYDNYIGSTFEKNELLSVFLKEPWKSCLIHELLENKPVSYSQSKLVLSRGEISSLLEIFNERMLAKTVFKSRADEMVPKVVSYTTEQILTAMFGKNAQIFIYFCGKMLWFRTRYLAMKTDELLSIISISRCFDAATNSQIEVTKDPVLSEELTTNPLLLLEEITTEPPVLPRNVIAGLFAIFQKGSITRSAFKTKADKMFPFVSMYSFDELILSMFGKHIGKYLVFTADDLVLLREVEHHKWSKDVIVSNLEDPLIKDSFSKPVLTQPQVKKINDPAFPKAIATSPQPLVLSIDAAAQLFQILQQGVVTKTAFKTKADIMFPSVHGYAFDHIISAMFCNHIDRYVHITQNEVRIKEKYRKMANSGVRSSLKTARKKRKVKKSHKQN